MTAEVTAPEAQQQERDQKRQLALLKAVGLDRVPVEQRELALAIAKRYDLDLLLKHLVLIDGKPYVTRDALLWIAHRSGQFDGISVTEPVLRDGFWTSEATVYRKDMSHPFVYGGRYPEKGQNQKFAPEMAIKVAESMALRRAFNVSAPTQDERWDVDVPVTEPPKPLSLAERAAAKAEEIHADGQAAAKEPAADLSNPESAPPAPVVDQSTGEILETAVAEFEEILERSEWAQGGAGNTEPPAAAPEEQAAQAPKRETVQCESMSPYSSDEHRCRRERGHAGVHRFDGNETWT